MAEKTLNELVLRIARRLGHAASGTGEIGSTTSSLFDPKTLWQPDNTWAGHYIRFLTGKNANLERLITAHTQSTKTLTFDPAAPYAVAFGDQYMILPLEYVYFTDAISNAVDSAGSAWVRIVDDTTTLTFNGDQEYSLPTDMVMLYQVWTGDGSTWAPVYTYDVLGAPGAYKLLFRAYPDRFDANGNPTSTIRLLYAAAPADLGKPYGTLEMGGSADREVSLYIQEMALYFIHQMLWSRNPTGEQARSHMSKHQQHKAAADQIKAERKPIPPAATMQRRRYANQI